MNDIIINDSNIAINLTPPPRLRPKEKHFKKMWKIWGWRLYLTHNFRLKNSQARDQQRDHNGIIKTKRKLWAQYEGHCQICGKKIDKFGSSQVHHILSWWRFPEYENDERNLLLLCRDCHSHIHKDCFCECRLVTAKAKELGINLKEYYDV